MRLLVGLLVLLSVGSWADDFKEAQKAIRMRNFEQAFILYRNEARAGNIEAQYQTGKMYLSGMGGEKNKAKAAFWFDKASLAGHAAAQYNLAIILEDSDPERAKALLEQSASQHYVAAVNKLSRIDDRSANSDLSQEQQYFLAAKKDDVNTLMDLRKAGFNLTKRDDSKRSALYIAVEFKAYDAQAWLLKQGLSPIEKDKFGITPLARSIEIGDWKAFSKLLSYTKKAIPSLPNGDTVLHLAIRKDYQRVINKLVKSPLDINAQNKDGWTALDLATHLKQTKTIQLLEKNNAKNGSGWLKDDMSHVDSVVKRLDESSASEHMTPLEEVLINDKYELFYKILIGYPVELLNQPQKSGNSIIGLAVKQKKERYINALLAKGVSVNVASESGETPLISAVKMGDLKFVNLLLDHGADVLTRDKRDRDAMLYAIGSENNYIALRLLEHMKDNFIEYPAAAYVLEAVKANQTDVVKQLTYKRYKLNLLDEHQRNALWYAALNKNAALIPKLVDAGVDPKSVDDLGQSHLQIAVKSGCLDCVRALSDYSNVNHQTNDGSTALMIAAELGDTSTVKWLITNGADVELRNNLGNTAIIYAVQSKSQSVVGLLIDADANVTRKNKYGLSAMDIAKKTSKPIHKMLKDSTLLGIF